MVVCCNVVELEVLCDVETVVVATMGDGWVGKTIVGAVLVVLGTVLVVPKMSSESWESS